MCDVYSDFSPISFHKVWLVVSDVLDPARFFRGERATILRNIDRLVEFSFVCLRVLPGFEFHIAIALVFENG